MNKGEIYVGVVIAAGIFVMLSQAVILLANTGYELIGFTRARNVARALASEKVEYAKNLPFDSVGTVGGIPSGTIPQTETISRNGQQYVVKTTVVYVDDPFDSLSPTDLVPNDYKRVRVDVTWTGFGPRGTTTTIITDIAPKGVEKVTGGGTLSLLVFDGAGSPVSNAQISIVATSAGVNQNVTTNDNGRIVIPGAPACVNCYRVTATKSGYGVDRTYGATEVANPAKPFLTVVAGGLTEMSFTIDVLASLTINTAGSKILGFQPLPGAQIVLTGSKTIGTDTLDNPVYKYNQTLTSNSSGVISLNNIEPDLYSLSLPQGTPYEIAYTNPLFPYQLPSNQTVTANVSLPTQAIPSLRVAFTTALKTPIASVSAELIDGVNPVASASSGLSDAIDFGQVFWQSLNTKTYTLNATASGYTNISIPISVSGSKFEEVIMSP